jgi:hypothetical protein
MIIENFFFKLNFETHIICDKKSKIIQIKRNNHDKISKQMHKM